MLLTIYLTGLVVFTLTALAFFHATELKDSGPVPFSASALGLFALAVWPASLLAMFFEPTKIFVEK
jgi:hypothetical protein